ncbi:unnamed protein product [Prorocentrum cordatum]|uniref:Aldehyde oxidase/xanthine dehydrogenase a/b hammerhead domain-containing protein n=1 Tax=Prorocentrum cordatum TaxID=2364126 RepID=A0ABN9TBM3_9DINO|nr:unnamed protein product [Polarella glacialis]
MESSTFFGAAEIEEARLQSDKLGGLRRRCIPLHRARRSAERHDEPRGAQAGLQKVEGHVDLGGTSHWYFEPQTALVIPTEGSIEVWTGDQNPVATQQSVSSVLQMPARGPAGLPLSCLLHLRPLRRGSVLPPPRPQGWLWSGCQCGKCEWNDVLDRTNSRRPGFGGTVLAHPKDILDRKGKRWKELCTSAGWMAAGSAAADVLAGEGAAVARIPEPVRADILEKERVPYLTRMRIIRSHIDAMGAEKQLQPSGDQTGRHPRRSSGRLGRAHLPYIRAAMVQALHVGSTQSDYEAEFDGDGKLSKIQMRFHMDVGCFLGDADDDLSMAIGFSDNAFYCPSFKCDGVPYMTHTMHRTSQRAPGVLQSICSMQVILEHISRSLKLPFELVQEKNFYSAGQQTPFGDTLGSDVYNWTLPELWQQLKRDADFDTRSSAVDTFNSANRWRKRGIAMVPCKYVMGLSDYNMNALVNVYSDGSVLVAHGGCEIGQGIHTKVAQAVAYTLGVDLKYVQVADTETSKTPGNACTGGSGTSESCSQAAINAAQVLKDRLASYRTGGKSWPEAAMAAAQAKENLSAEGFFKGAASAENAHTYAVYGAGMSEVEVDVLTGEMEILRVDILMDLGRQLNAAVDIGQLEGGFVMALGYFFTEELKFDEQARPLNLGTWEYKIPSAFDIPREFNVSIMKPVLNPSGVLGSKACAEPVMPLAASAYFAVKQAVGAARKQLGLGDGFFDLPVPATVECIQQACAPQGGGGVPTGLGA